MPHFHNDQITNHGQDLDFVDKPPARVRSSKAPKRKRVAKNKMLDNKQLASSAASDTVVREDMAQDLFSSAGEWPYNAYTFGSDSAPLYGGYTGDHDTVTHGLPMSDAFAVGGDYHEANAPLPPMFPAFSDVEQYHFSSSAYGCPTETGQEMTEAAQSVPEEVVSANGAQQIKKEVEDKTVSFIPQAESEDESDYEDRRPSKVPKTNKDGNPRKPRQPRPKLLKWDDNDWKNVALGLVWACGENGIQIPFDQASQVVSESCTAGALQQALLKLRGKQIDQGYQIPPLRMAWTRKNKKTNSDTSRANSLKPQEQATGATKNAVPKKKPTRFVGMQSKVVTLRRAYIDADRAHLAAPHTVVNIGSAVPRGSGAYDYNAAAGQAALSLASARGRPAGNAQTLSSNGSFGGFQMCFAPEINVAHAFQQRLAPQLEFPHPFSPQTQALVTPTNPSQDRDVGYRARGIAQIGDHDNVEGFPFGPVLAYPDIGDHPNTVDFKFPPDDADAVPSTPTRSTGNAEFLFSPPGAPTKGRRTHGHTRSMAVGSIPPPIMRELQQTVSRRSPTPQAPGRSAKAGNGKKVTFAQIPEESTKAETDEEMLIDLLGSELNGTCSSSNAPKGGFYDDDNEGGFGGGPFGHGSIAQPLF